jgi:serine/threonine protein kinase
MPFSNQPSVAANTTQSLSILQERYALRRCMAETALGKLYWAQDLKQQQGNGEQANVLAFTLLPALAQDPVFEQVLGHVLPAYQKPVLGMPHITDDGKSADGTRWLVMRNIGGMLLSERLAELDERGMPLPEVLELLDGISHLLASQRPDGVFGYLEPNAILLNERSPCLLTAPVAAALRMSYSNNPSERTRKTLHSGYISPEVLLGDTPIPEDDTFSIACLAYHLLQGNAPFGKYSALEATVRNAAPSSIRKLRPDTWTALRQGLNLKRVARQKNPTALLNTLQRKQQKKLLLPLAGLVAAGAVALTTYQLLSSWGNAPEDLTQPNTGTAPLSATESAALVNEQAVPPALDQESNEIANQAKPTASTSLSNLQAQASDAILQGKLLSDNPDTPAALDYLRQAIALEPDNTQTQTLLAQLINQQHAEAETLLNTGKLDEASKLLSTADRLISEFTLADSLKRQVSLEAAVSQAQRNQALAPEPETPADTATLSDTATPAADMDNLARAREAIDYGNLSRGDDRSESAIAYLSPLLEKTPDHPEALTLLEKVVDAQQEAASTHLSKRDTEKARTALNDSQVLIGKYQLDNRVEAQIALEKRYRETLAMGVFTPGTEPEAPTPAPHNISATPSAAEPVDPTNQERENPEAAEAAAAAANTAPVEVRVSPDVPVRSAMETPMPTTDADNTGNTFTLDVPNLIEVPLDTIKDSLPPVDR